MNLDKVCIPLVISAMLIITAPVVAQDAPDQTTIETQDGDKIYRYRGPDGEVVYTDQPPPQGAEPVQVPKASGYEFQSTPRFEPYQEPEPREPANPYDTLRVTYPEEDQVIWDNTGTMRVSVAIEPALQQGHRLQLLFNGEVRYTGSSTTVTLSEVWRNTYTIVPQVIDGQGETVARGEGVTFHMKQHSAKF